jgi:hypothetical protein
MYVSDSSSGTCNVCTAMTQFPEPCMWKQDMPYDDEISINGAERLEWCITHY